MLTSTKKITGYLFMIGLMLFPVSFIQAQGTRDIENVDFFLRNDSLFVTYDIVNFRKSDRFNIHIRITTASKKVINPKTLSGDIGNNIKGGPGKKIAWDLKKDGAVINEGISVEVLSDVLLASDKFVPRGIALLYSAVVPGLGITKLKKGGPYWILSIGFYGSAVASYVYYSSAKSNYNKYLEIMDETERNAMYDKVKSQNTVSSILMYTAAAIWVGNMIWTAVTPNKTKPKNDGFSFGVSYDPQFAEPVLSVRYKF